MGLPASTRVLVLLSLRSIVAHKWKSLIVGGILAFGTFLLVLGTTLLDNIERSMEASITGTLIGHLQVHSKEARDGLAFFGPQASSNQDLGTIQDFGRVRAELEKLPDVRAVVPMGRDVAMAVGGNDMDEALGELRRAVGENDADHVRTLQARVRQLAGFMQAEYRNRMALTRDQAEAARVLASLDRAVSDEFWAQFGAEPLAALDFLDNKVAPVEAEGSTLFLPYIGTDLDAFAREFDRFQIVRGSMVPKGQRGILINQTFLDELAKNKVARELDLVRKRMADKGVRIADDPYLREKVRSMGKQYGRVLYELSPEGAAALEPKLRSLLGSADGGLAQLLQKFLEVDDANFEQRYAFFYKEMAPLVRLYRVRPGDTVTLRAMGRNGYTRAVNIKVWGTFIFRGLESSILASRYNLVDLMSFRDMYGLMTPERRRELEQMRRQVGVRDVARENAEEQLFGEAAAVEESKGAAAIDLPAPPAPTRGAPADERTFGQADIDNGVVLHAAVVLKPGASMRRALPEVTRAAEALGLAVVHWKQAAGVIGQLIRVMSGVLWIAIAIIFAVALVIINNSMLMATMDRVAEIGTMRAIGAQRRFVLGMFLLETTVLGAIAGTVGASAAAALVSFLGKVGISSGGQDALVLLFGGARLHPVLSAVDIVIALVLIGLVGFVATLHPARVATRIAPVVAMQRQE